MRTHALVRVDFVAKASLIAAVALVALATRPAAASPPWAFASFKRIDANPNKNYPVTESSGPWMIMVTTFRGDPSVAQREAQQLVYELRKQYKLNAYSHGKTFDYTQKNLPGLGVNPDGSPKTMCYVNQAKFEEVAVMVGDFRRVDDPEAQKTLAMLKHAVPDCLKSKNPAAADHTPWGDYLRDLSRKMRGAQPAGPLAGAFITTNPLLPREYFVNKGIDKLVVEMNAGVPHSLLNCRGKYSVQIATFAGHVIIDQQKIRQIESGRAVETGDGLAEAADKAHALTEYLRSKGVEAYEFHDRHSSIVTVGSFDSLGSPRPDGRTELDPRIHKIMTEYGATSAGMPGGSTAAIEGLRLKSFTLPVGPEHIRKPIACDVRPTPVEVPHRSISSDYQQAAATR